MPVDPANGQVWFTESGLRFGPFPPDTVWEVEASQLYASFGDDNPKAVEAVVFRTPPRRASRVVFLEAKTAAEWGPSPGDSEAVRKARLKAVEDWDQAICDKLLHSLHLWIGVAHGWWQEPAFPSKLTVAHAPMQAVELSLVLVVSRAPNPEAYGLLHSRLNPRVQRLARALPQRRVDLIVIDPETARARRWCA